MEENIKCPKCGVETHVNLVRKATKIATVIGGAAGTVSGYSGCNTGILGIIKQTGKNPHRVHRTNLNVT